MYPLFMLPKQPAPIFGRTTNFEYKKTLPDSVFNPFSPAARHVFRWQNQAGEWWVPSQSYLRIRLAFCAVGENGVLRPLSPADGVAPVMNLPPHLFSRMEYYMDGNKLSELQDYIPQIDTMKHRMMKSRAWMAAVGNRGCFWSPDFATRQALVTPSLGSSISPSTLRTGDIPGQRILFDAGAAILPTGTKSGTNGFSTAGGSFFARYIPAVDDEKNVGLTEIDVYGVNFRTATWNERKAILTPGSAAGTGSMVGTQVVLTIQYAQKQSKSMVATWDPVNDLFFVCRNASITGGSGAERAVHVPGSGAGPTSVPNGLYTDIKTTFLPHVYETKWPLVADDVTAIATGVSANVATRVIVTPIEPSTKITSSVRHEVCWKPTLGIFDVAHALPTTRHELHLQIPNDYQLRCFDFGNVGTSPSYLTDRVLDPRVSNNTLFSGNELGRVFLRIENIEFFAAMASGPRADDAKYILDLREYRMIPQPIPLTQTVSSNTYPFNLAPNTSSVSVAFQTSKAGNGSCSLSKFIVPTQLFQRGAETALSRFYVNFANQNRPREENESFVTYDGPNTAVTQGNSRATSSTQFFTQRYIETMTNTGQLFKPGGCETLEEWFERGAYYNWMWPRDGNDLSTRFHVFCSFQAATPLVTTTATEANTQMGIPELSTELVNRSWPSTIQDNNNDINILVFDMIPRAFSLSLRNGSVVSAETTSSMVADGVRRVRTE